MKKLILILFVPFVLIGQTNNIPPSVQEKINQAKDYYDLTLYEDSKKLLLELLHSDEGKDGESEIRYHLGLASFYEGNTNSAMIQWKQVIRKYPTSERARELNRMMANYISSEDENEYFREEEFEYNDDIKSGFRFWTPIALNEKLFLGDLKNPEGALSFYEKLIHKYDDPEKKFHFLAATFLILSGYNSNDYGYKNQKANPEGKPSYNNHERRIKVILAQMEEKVTDENDPNYYSLVRAYYLWGVRRSGSRLFSGRVKVNKYSKPFFEKVIELTENSPNNIYRIFSEHWLNQ